MSTTMEPKLKKEKKEKSSKKRKAAESLEDGVETSTTATAPLSPPPTVEKKSKKKSSKTESSAAPSSTSDEPPAKKRKSLSTIPAEIEVDITAPTPPTKRALRLLKKGKAAPPLKPENRPDSDSEAEDSSNEATADGSRKSSSKKAKPEVEKRSEHGIWIGNLPWSCDKNALRAFLTVPNTSIPPTAITRIHMPSPADAMPANHVPDARNSRKPLNKGFAYVDFAEAEHVKLALEMSEELLTGRRVLIKDQKSFEGRPEKTKEEKRLDAGGKPPNKRVFLGNLRYDATVESLTEHFSPCGAIDMVFVATFEDSGKCKGYAWITFAELESAEKAVRGWTMVPQSTSNDDDNASADSDDSASEEETKKPAKIKMKKVWVNQIAGRPVRREFAEDAQVRYKKRYGKDGTKAAGSSSATAADGSEAPARARPAREKRTETGDAGGGEGGAVPQAKPADFYRNSYAPRLTGGVVASTGKKVVF